jgi:hypothetical protein
MFIPVMIFSLIGACFVLGFLVSFSFSSLPNSLCLSPCFIEISSASISHTEGRGCCRAWFGITATFAVPRCAAADAEHLEV